MAEMKPDKQMKSSGHKYQFTDKFACCKWFDRRSVTMLASNISGMESTSTVQRRMNVSATNTLVQLLLKCIITVWVVST